MHKVFFFLILPFLLTAQNDSLRFDTEIIKGQLSNGLTYYIKQNKFPEKKAELRLFVKAGSLVENEDEQGMAHFVEHMNFNGTKKYPKNEIINYLQTLGMAFGADINAITGFRQTIYQLSVPLDKKDNLNKGLDILKEWAFEATFDSLEIEKEKGVIYEEMRLGLGKQKRISEKIIPIIYEGSRYAERLPIGKKEKIERFKKSNLVNFYKNWYRPDSMAIIVVGDIDVKEVEKQIKKLFSPYKKPSFHNLIINNNYIPIKDTIIVIQDDPELINNEISFKFINRETISNKFNLEKWNNVMKNIFFMTLLNNRLNDILTNSSNLPFIDYTFNADSQDIGNRLSSAVSFTTAGSNDKLQKTIRLFRTELERIKQYGFTSEELARVKANYLASYENLYANKDKRNSAGLIDFMMSNFAYGTELLNYEYLYHTNKNFIQNVTIEDISLRYKSLIDDRYKTIVITQPKQSITEKEVVAILNEPIQNVTPPKTDKELILFNENIKPGEIVKTIEDPMMGTTTLELSNGLKVVYKKTDFKNNEVLFSGYRYGGHSLWKDEDFNKVKHAIGSISGVNGLTRNEINKLLAGKNMSVTFPQINENSDNTSGYASTKDFETLMQMIYLSFMKINEDDELFQNNKNKNIAMFKQVNNDPNYYFQNQLNFFLGQNDKRTSNLIPTEEEWSRVDQKLAIQKYKEEFANLDGFTFFFVGNISDSLMRNYAEKYLASLPTSGIKPQFKDRNIPLVTGYQEKIFNRGKEPVGIAYIIFQGNAPFDKNEELAITFLVKILQIKLMETIREKFSQVYNISVGGEMTRIPKGYYNLGINYVSDSLLLDIIKSKCMAEIHHIIDKGVEQGDIKKVQQEILLGRKEELKNNQFWVNTLDYLYFNGEDPHDLFNYEKRVENITSKQIQETAKKYFSKDNYLYIKFLPEK